MTLTAIVVILVATVLGGISGGIGATAGGFIMDRVKDRRLKREFEEKWTIAERRPRKPDPPKHHPYRIQSAPLGQKCACHPAWECKSHGECRACECGCDTT